MNRINDEQNTYLLNERQKFNDLQTESHNIRLEISEVKEQLNAKNDQIVRILKNFEDEKVLFIIYFLNLIFNKFFFFFRICQMNG